jgi:hypothetical protein
LARGYEAGALSVRFGAAGRGLGDKEAKKYHLRLALPGVDPSTVELKVLGNLLTISAERKASREAKDVDYLYRELGYGTLSRTLTLPEGLDTEQINAEYNDGLLEITAPVAAAALPRLGEIKGKPLDDDHGRATLGTKPKRARLLSSGDGGFDLRLRLPRRVIAGKAAAEWSVAGWQGSRSCGCERNLSGAGAAGNGTRTHRAIRSSVCVHCCQPSRASER